MRWIGSRKGNLIEHRLNFTLRRVGIAQLAGMADVKIHDDVVIGRNLGDRWTAWLGPRRRRPRYSAYVGKDVNTLALVVIFGRDITWSVRRRGTRIQERADAVVPRR